MNQSPGGSGLLSGRLASNDINPLAEQSCDSLAESTSSHGFELSVVIPCLNEARSIAICVDKALAAFRESGVSGEVVVADNGSDDGSVKIAEMHGARVVHVKARGYGNALRKGIEEARGEFIIMGDADDSYDFAEAPKFIAMWREGHELVMGNRFKGGIQPGAMPPLHEHFGNPGLTWLLNALFGAGVGDVYCGMRGFTKGLYLRVDPRTTGMEFALELIIKAKKLGASYRRSSDQIVAGQTRPPPPPSYLSRWLAQPSIHVALCAQLAVPFSRCVSVFAGRRNCPLAVAGTARYRQASHRRAYHALRHGICDYWRADCFHWPVCKGF